MGVVALLAGLLIAVERPADAGAELLCPSEARSFVDNDSVWPPYGAALGDASGMVGCESSYTAPDDTVAALELHFDLRDEDCGDLVVYARGTPSDGWGIVVFDPTTASPVRPHVPEDPNGQGGPVDGFIQRYGVGELEWVEYAGATLFAGPAQPPVGSGPYTLGVNSWTEPSPITGGVVVVGIIGLDGATDSAEADVLDEVRVTGCGPQTAEPPTTTTSPPTAPACDPNYTGACVPLGVEDVDCAGGSDDGPYYVSTPVQVIGSDPYRLDTDGDGTGCEQLAALAVSTAPSFTG